MSGMHSTKLEFDQKKNVFVTQLGEREEEEYNVRKFPVVEEVPTYSSPRTLPPLPGPPSLAQCQYTPCYHAHHPFHVLHNTTNVLNEWALVRDGMRTLQSTLLLQKQQEMHTVDMELQSKRRQFAGRMERCMTRQNELRIQQQQIKERVEKFDRFVRENEIKRQRAIQKYHNEKRQKELREDEVSALKLRYQSLERKQARMIRILEDHKRFEKYIQQVVDILPEGYLELTDNMLKGVMMRYNTLQQANEGLLQELMMKGDAIDAAQGELSELNKNGTDEVLGYNSTIAALHSKLDRCFQSTVRKEERAINKKKSLRQQYQLYGQLELATCNLVDKCRGGKPKPGHPPHTLIKQLSIIQSYLLERESIYNMTTNMATPASSPGPTKEVKEVKDVKE